MQRASDGCGAAGLSIPRRQTRSSGSSAVCAFSLDAIQKAFDGKYKELNKDCSRWMTYSGPPMAPRPGSVSVVVALPPLATLLANTGPETFGSGLDHLWKGGMW